MTALLAMCFKLQFGLTAFMGLSFSMAMRGIEVDAAELQLEVEKLEAQQLEVKPAEKEKPVPVKPEKKAEPEKK